MHEPKLEAGRFVCKYILYQALGSKLVYGIYKGDEGGLLVINTEPYPYGDCGQVLC